MKDDKEDEQWRVRRETWLREEEEANTPKKEEAEEAAAEEEVEENKFASGLKSNVQIVEV